MEAGEGVEALDMEGRRGPAGPQEQDSRRRVSHVDAIETRDGATD